MFLLRVYINQEIFYVYLYTCIFDLYSFGRDAKVVHFLGATKPWNYKYNLQTKRVMQDGTTSGSSHQLSFLALWWNIYSASILPLLEKLQKMEESESEECKVTDKELVGICWNQNQKFWKLVEEEMIWCVGLTLAGFQVPTKATLSLSS